MDTPHRHYGELAVGRHGTIKFAKQVVVGDRLIWLDRAIDIANQQKLAEVQTVEQRKSQMLINGERMHENTLVFAVDPTS